MTSGPVFQPTLLSFLEELAGNNNRAWFTENKARYEKDVLFPCLDFIAAMGPRLQKISPRFEAIPRRMGGSLMRVYRDTRFGHDKTPYKTNVGIQFRHVLGKDVHAPGFYLHIQPREVFVGVGSWRPDPDALRKIRERIVAKPKLWQQAVGERKFSRHFELSGDTLIRPPKNVDANHPLIVDLKRKDFIALKYLDQQRILEPGFMGEVTRLFTAGAPLMKFLCDALAIDF